MVAIEHNVRATIVVKAAVADAAVEAVAEGLAGEAGGGVMGLGEDAVALIGGCGDEVARVIGPGLGIPVTEGVGERAAAGSARVRTISRALPNRALQIESRLGEDARGSREQGMPVTICKMHHCFRYQRRKWVKLKQ